MNTLAHLALGYPDPQLMLGQFLGDHVKGRVEDSLYPTRVQQGIRDHRRIDALSDRHVITQYAKSLLPKEQRRFAGLVLDLYSDALLGQTWDTCMEVPLKRFLHASEELLQHPPEPLSGSAKRYADRLIQYGLLEAYLDVEELPDILDRMGSHLRRPQVLSPILYQLRKEEESFLSKFPGYFADMVATLEPR